uniref:Uncharacterized protein n=1 Tax=Pristionchus pacificus TaxID=54126 RepID=A0A2A6D210_PRIPA|eukprot:PDM84445.1 hypothetical protein PRIPAC_33468 [Pristionchus pacificus]
MLFTIGDRNNTVYVIETEMCNGNNALTLYYQKHWVHDDTRNTTTFTVGLNAEEIVDVDCACWERDRVAFCCSMNCAIRAARDCCTPRLKKNLKLLNLPSLLHWRLNFRYTFRRLFTMIHNEKNTRAYLVCLLVEMRHHQNRRPLNKLNRKE